MRKKNGKIGITRICHTGHRDVSRIVSPGIWSTAKHPDVGATAKNTVAENISIMINDKRIFFLRFMF